MSQCPLTEGKQTCSLVTKSSPSSTLFCPSGHPNEKAALALESRSSAYIPGAQPHCCGGSWQSGHLAGSPWHRQTPETPFHQTQCPHYSRPTSSPRLGSPGGGYCTHRWLLSPLHTSVSPRRPLQQRQWHGQRLTPGWLQRKEMAVKEGSEEGCIPKAGIQESGLRTQHTQDLTIVLLGVFSEEYWP